MTHEYKLVRIGLFRKEVRNMAGAKEDSKKSGTLSKVVREIKTSVCDCGCGCVPLLDKK